MVESALIERAFRALELQPGTLAATAREVGRLLERDGREPVYVVGLSGGGAARGDAWRLAEAVGYRVAERGAVLVTGGLGGVMEAACRGASHAGGLSIGILPGADPGAANRYVDLSIPTGWQEGRNFLISFLSDGLIAVDGGYGTLSEVALSLKLGRPVVGLRCPWELPDLRVAGGAQGAVDWLWRQLARGRADAGKRGERP